ncbi:uncharacterized protein LOC128243783 [Mya arenaria]|uniref:uncharacterized protein LOC128243242 n=1 Tax=Mya arenaria TaxID=6604 RepID=UPI0022E0BE7B|nr:uncharacterized protein LOC128243242 [Mya arenaria]XP_052817683.1 uncharacterized protein LOC128243783 [Mya arenaria]
MGFFKCSQLWILFLVVFVRSTEARGTKYGVAFRSLMDENGYKGGATGVLVGNRLAYVEGYGTTLTDHMMEATTVLPASGISKILTALTALKLIQEGKMYPSDKVFGADGALSHLVEKNVVKDNRIFDITVDDLLRHSGGWDADISKIADPVFNEFLVDGNQHIVNISKELKLKKALSQEDIIKFMLTQDLDFTPGTKSSVSNYGYLLLGRVIEQVTNETYAVAVKEDVLVNCGMWHTRLGPHQTEGNLPFKGKKTREINAQLREKHQVIGEYYAYIQPHLVDSGLGWFTNAYDVMRLAQCIDGTADYMLLNATTIDLMLQKPKYAPDATSWFGAGFMVHENGAVWVNDETHAPDVVFLHKNLQRFHLKREYTGDENDPVAWTLLFEGKPSIDAPLKQLSRVMIESETHWPTINSFVDDLYDRLLSMGSSTKVIKLKIEEHRANQFLIALKRVEFNVVWVNAYTHDDGTFITVIAEQDPKASRECVALAGLPLRKLVERKLELEEEGYNITFIQNYKSFSHRDSFVFIGVFHKGAFRNDSHILYGIQHFDRPYKTLLSLYEEKGFKPLVQSLEYNRDDALLTFILEADSGNEKDQKEIYSSEMDLNEARLERAVQKYAKQQSRLIYLDASNHRGRPKFSALFKKSRKTTWLFSLGQTPEQILDTVTEKQKEGYLPSVIVGYSTSKKSTGPKFAIYLEKPTESKRFL